jgi:hypothetical protein
MQAFARAPSHLSLFKGLLASPIRALNESYGVTLIKGNLGTFRFPAPQIRQPYPQSDIDFRTGSETCFRLKNPRKDGAVELS